MKLTNFVKIDGHNLGILLEFCNYENDKEIEFFNKDNDSEKSDLVTFNKELNATPKFLNDFLSESLGIDAIKHGVDLTDIANEINSISGISSAKEAVYKEINPLNLKREMLENHYKQPKIIGLYDLDRIEHLTNNPNGFYEFDLLPHTNDCYKSALHEKIGIIGGMIDCINEINPSHNFCVMMLQFMNNRELLNDLGCSPDSMPSAQDQLTTVFTAKLEKLKHELKHKEKADKERQMSALKEAYESTPLPFDKNLHKHFEKYLDEHDKPHSDFITKLSCFYLASQALKESTALKEARENRDRQFNHGSADGGHTYSADFIQKMIDKNELPQKINELK